MRIQEQLGQNRMRFAQRLTEMSEELFALAREGEKQRKIVGRTTVCFADRCSTRTTALATRVFCRRAKESWTR